MVEGPETTSPAANTLFDEVSDFLNGCIVQADESLMRGRRKYNRGRLLIGDVLDSIVDHN